MGNNSTASNSTSSPSSILSPNMSDYFDFHSNFSSVSNSSGSFGFGGSSWWYITWTTGSMTAILNHCVVGAGAIVYLVLKVLILVTAFPSNIVLAWLLFKSRNNLSPSQLLALNISILDLFYCTVLPLDVYSMLYGTSKTVHCIREAFSTLNIFGCPLLLTFMCLERYFAAAMPITYLRLGKWKYRIAMCVLAWVLILCVAVLAYFFLVFPLILSVVIVIIALFFVMLVCLVGIVWVLRQDGPGDGLSRSDSLKKRALNNVLMVIVPAVMAYTPLVIAVGLLIVIIANGTKGYTMQQCKAMQFLFAFPNFGLYIGPLFYLSRIRQIICCRKQMENTVSKTQAE